MSVAEAICGCRAPNVGDFVRLSLARSWRQTSGVIPIDGDVGVTPDDWRALELCAPFPTLTYEWVSACAAHLYPAGRFRPAVVRQSDTLHAVAPVAIAGRWPARRFELAGVSTLYEPTDLLADSLEHRRAVVAQIHRSQLALRLDRIPSDSPTVAVVRELYRRGLVVVRPSTSCQFLALGSGWCEPASQLSARRRSDLRRARRRAEALGPVETTVLAPDVTQVDALLEVAFAIEARSWKGAQGSALLFDAQRAAFYREFCRHAARDGRLRVVLLSIGGEHAAMQLALEWRDAYWLLKTGYDERWSRCSPGILLIEDSIRYAARRGLKSYEFLGESEPWIAAWTETHRPLVNVRAYPLSLAGACALAADGAALFAQRSRARLKACKTTWHQALSAFSVAWRTRSRNEPPGPTSSAPASTTRHAFADGSNGRGSSPASGTGTTTKTPRARCLNSACEPSAMPPA
jgi:CelD/BcsL family acetyltransferase involved in cellulose biosynthesis